MPMPKILLNHDQNLQQEVYLYTKTTIILINIPLTVNYNIIFCQKMLNSTFIVIYSGSKIILLFGQKNLL